jgi:rRNA pseudouridine-1189 N-methylase Emg1 (Nep1/Mra1 family)
MNQKALSNIMDNILIQLSILEDKSEILKLESNKLWERLKETRTEKGN